MGISGGIAAYKILDLIRLLQEEEINVSVVLTRSASHLVDKKILEILTENKVFDELFEKNFNYKTILRNRSVDHISLADNTDLFVIAPATANVIAKLANGIADDYLTTTALAVTKPLLVCPSMNVNMWNNPIVAENVDRLRFFGHHIIEPTEGELACGYIGQGRLEDIEIIRDEITKRINEIKILKGKRIVVTAGGTSEPIDSVRSITNKSTGKMGIAIAQTCFLKGASVTLLRSKQTIKPRFIMKEETFDTTKDLYNLVKKYAANADIFFHVAAVSDFEVARKFTGKISSKQNLKLTLKPTMKISNEIKKINPNLYLVLFKAEHNLTEEKLLKAAKQKMREARADVVVANDISKPDRGFGADTNKISVVLKNGAYKRFPLARKEDVAEQLVNYLFKSMKQTSVASLIQ